MMTEQEIAALLADDDGIAESADWYYGSPSWDEGDIDEQAADATYRDEFAERAARRVFAGVSR